MDINWVKIRTIILKVWPEVCELTGWIRKQQTEPKPGGDPRLSPAASELPIAASVATESRWDEPEDRKERTEVPVPVPIV